jgi:predicted kinase
MEAILFIGIQASGKSTFYKEKFFNTHLRISNDLLKTKNREKLLIEYCKDTHMPFVIDNTNVTRAIRSQYMNILKEMNYKIIGYYFKTNLTRSLEWNKKRLGKELIPEVGILGMHKKLEIPSIEEGFNALYYVDIVNDEFIVKEWNNEI